MGEGSASRGSVCGSSDVSLVGGRQFPSVLRRQKGHSACKNLLQLPLMIFFPLILNSLTSVEECRVVNQNLKAVVILQLGVIQCNYIQLGRHRIQAIKA